MDIGKFTIRDIIVITTAELSRIVKTAMNNMVMPSINPFSLLQVKPMLNVLDAILYFNVSAFLVSFH